MKIRFLFSIFWLAIYSNAFAQESGLRFEQITTKDGLSQSTVNDILQDSVGFLWFATDDGLNRYDGYEFRVFQSRIGSSTTLVSNQITRIIEDSDHNIWIATNGGGLSKYDRANDEFTNYMHDPDDERSLSSNFITAIYEDRSGAIVVGTQKGLNFLIPETGIVSRYEAREPNFNGLKDGLITTLFEDDNSFLWIGTEKEGLFHLDREQDTFTNFKTSSRDGASISDNWVVTLYNDSQGNLWVGTQAGGLNMYNPDTESFTRYPTSGQRRGISHNWVLSMFEDNKGTFWIGTLDGLNILDRETGEFTKFDDLNYSINLSNNSITSLFEDRSGVLWVGTREGALNKFVYSTENFTVYQANPSNINSLNDDIVWSVLEDGESLWIGTQGGGLNHINRTTGEARYYTHDPSNPQSISDNYVNKVYKDSKGNLWIGTINGLDRLVDAEKGTFEHFKSDDAENSLSSNIITTIFEDSKGILWVGTLNDGLNAYDPETERFTAFKSDSDNPNSISHNKIWSMNEDRSGNFWVGTHGYGLNKYDRVRGRFTTYSHDPSNENSLSNNFINFIHEDRSGNLWIGTLNGLNKFDPKTETFTRVTRETSSGGFPNNVTYGIVEDYRGHLWVSTNKGIVDFHPDADLTDNASFITYDQADGLPSDEYRFGAYFKGEDGDLYFGGINGLVVFAPDSVTNNLITPDVVFTDFQIDNEEVSIGSDSPLNASITVTKEIVLDYDERDISFEFAALHFAAPTQNRYKYKLENYDEEWKDSGSRRETQYTNLSPNTYIFKVRAANKDNIWLTEENAVAIRVIIKPPFWMTIWAYSFYALSFFGGLIGFINYRVSNERRKKEKVLEENRKLEGLVKERTQELEVEKTKSDSLLYNMLPKDVAEEIKEKGSAAPRRFEETSVLFTDFENFTTTASTMSASKLIAELNEIFEVFDLISEKNGLEKIKTIGDAYMAVAGLPSERADHAQIAANAAIEMQKYIEDRNERASVKWRMRAGIHSGNVIAGVVGKNKFTYDIWGNTVILASRMEESGVVGKVNVSASTYDLIRDNYDCEYRGKVDVEGKGEVDMYLIKENEEKN